MRSQSVVAVLLICMLLAADVDGWRVRRTLRRIRRVLKPVCKWACPRVCPLVFKDGIWRHVCGFTCKTVCGRKKRELENGTHVTPLPTDFGFYDMDKNGFLTVYEIADALGHLEIEDGLYMAFNSSDTNRDEKLSEDEFLLSTAFVFAEEPEEST
ncbi:EF-hand calcium-binding domain-containing protein 1-like [Liolophura sinensis]|uniref:EF-hand calcium-binding domain-containing protein 1-like n=1 Tax=Liolophura sinensis TaxID=3198878 RepID=UPI0031580702